MRSHYQSVEDVFAGARQIRQQLSKVGEMQAAAELDETMRTFWATASEALGEIKLSLLRVRPLVEKALDKNALRLLDSAVAGATALFDNPPQ